MRNITKFLVITALFMLAVPDAAEALKTKKEKAMDLCELNKVKCNVRCVTLIGCLYWERE